MEVVRESEPKKRKPRGKTNRQAVMQSRIQLVMRQVFTKAALVRLFANLDDRDQKDLLIAFNKPAPPPRPKDDIDKLSDEQVQQLTDQLLNRAK